MAIRFRSGAGVRFASLPLAVLVALGTVWSAAAARATEPAVPAKAGFATGTLQNGKLTVSLIHAYASGPFDFGGQVYRVVLTDAPIPPEALANELRRGGQTLLKAGKLQGLSLLVDESGYARTLVPFVGEPRGGSMLASVGQLSSFAVKAGSATGQGSLGSHRTMGQHR